MLPRRRNEFEFRVTLLSSTALPSCIMRKNPTDVGSNLPLQLWIETGTRSECLKLKYGNSEYKSGLPSWWVCLVYFSPSQAIGADTIAMFCPLALNRYQ